MLQTVITRLLSLATVLTLVLFAASAGLQPDTALAQPGCGPSGGQPPKCEDTTNGGDNDNDDDEDNDGADGTITGTGGTGIFFNICALPWFAPNPACALGLFGS